VKTPLVDMMLTLSLGIPVMSHSAQPAAAPAGEYHLEKSHASLVMRVNHMGFSTYTTRFSRFDADLSFDPKHIDASKVSATIDADSFEMDGAPSMCLNIMKGDQMLDTKKFPNYFHLADSATGGRQVIGDYRRVYAAWCDPAHGAQRIL
jgi:polyisoprenoid-binding protein YceI